MTVKNLLAVMLVVVIAPWAFGDVIYADKDDIIWALTSISPIGDLGDVETIIDLRGFVPISANSKAKVSGWDALQYHKVPTLEALARIYYGNVEAPTLTRLSKARILTEDKLSGESLKWAKFAYALAKTSGPGLFTSAGGTKEDLESSEPIAVFLTKNSAFVILNFRYSDFARIGTGQILCAFEFSRRLKEYKTFYLLSSTILFNKSAHDAFRLSLPLVAKVLAAQFQ